MEKLKPVNAKKTTLTILKYLPKPLLFMVRKPPSCGDSTKPKTTAHKRKTSGFEPKEPASPSPKVSCMGQIKHRTKAGKQRKFNGGRVALRGFDWMAVRPSDLSEDQEKMAVTDQFAPVLVEKRKEINLWKRRPMPPPAPLLIMN